MEIENLRKSRPVHFPAGLRLAHPKFSILNFQFSISNRFPLYRRTKTLSANRIGTVEDRHVGGAAPFALE